MKKLNKINLQNSVVLKDSEMKAIYGGSGSSGGSGVNTCDVYTTCPDGTELSITNCIGDCSSQSGVSVTCKGKTQTLTKSCGGSGTSF